MCKFAPILLATLHIVEKEKLRAIRISVEVYYKYAKTVMIFVLRN